MSAVCNRSHAGFTEWEEPRDCILCGASGLHKLPRLAHLKRCSTCGHVLLAPRPTQAAIAASYDIQDTGTHSTWDAQHDGRRRLWSKRADRVTRYYRQPGRALDLGAGFGDFLVELRMRGWEVAGTEVSENAVVRAGKRGIELELGQPEELDFPSESFDLVTMWHVLEHVPFPGRALDACARLVRPGGLVVIAVPNDSLFPRLMAYLITGKREARNALWGMRGPGEEIHLSFFSPRRLRRALERANLIPVELDLDDHYPEPNSETARELRRNRTMWRLTSRTFSLHRTIYAVSRRPPPQPR
jgi:2-polyprenyl-3-methyl-5-hydroxy-6-metoxy-1,4-benzoquinol methylase